MQYPQTIVRPSVAAGLCLLLALQLFADQQIQQPNSISPGTSRFELETTLDSAIEPTGCCDESASFEQRNSGCRDGKCGYKAVCCPKKATKEVKKHYWAVKTELVCIPGFRFEWNWGKGKYDKSKKSDCNCDDTCCSDGKCRCNDPGKPTCGRVRCINVLVKNEYTCEECGYEWQAKCVRTSSGSCCPTRGCMCPQCGKRNPSRVGGAQ